jgi:hypothetical protein
MTSSNLFWVQSRQMKMKSDSDSRSFPWKDLMSCSEDEGLSDLTYRVNLTSE